MRELLLVAYSCLNVPYVFGGNNPLAGMDCSGFIQWVLRSVGLDPPGRQNAQMLFDHFSKNGRWNSHQPGALIFFGQSASKITHIGMLVDQYRFIEAGHGDSTCTTKEIAAERGACVRISPLTLRKDVIAIIRPNYDCIGVV